MAVVKELWKTTIKGSKTTIAPKVSRTKVNNLVQERLREGTNLEPIKKQITYLGKRIRRGLFKSASGRVYGADQNGSLNIIQNAVGDSLFIGQPIMRLVVSPARIKPYKASNCHI